MRCLYCGKHLPLLRKLTGGGEFCSDAHRDKYHEEYNRLAVSRLLQAQTRPEEPKVAVSGTLQATEELEEQGVAVAVAEEPEPEMVSSSFIEVFQVPQIRPAPAHASLEIEVAPVLLDSAGPIRPLIQYGPSIQPVEGQFLASRASARHRTLSTEIGLPSAYDVEHILPRSSEFRFKDGQPGKAGLVALELALTPRGWRIAPLDLGVSAIDNFQHKPVITRISIWDGPDLPHATSRQLVLSAIAPVDDEQLDTGQIQDFPGLGEYHSEYVVRLKLLQESDSDSPEAPEPAEAPAQVLELASRAESQLESEPAQEPISEATPEPEPPAVTESKAELIVLSPRRVLEALQADRKQKKPPEPPISRTFKTIAIPAAASVTAVLSTGFDSMRFADKPRLLEYRTQPLRPKMAIGTAAGPLQVRTDANGTATGGRGQAGDGKNGSTRTMSRSMLHLEDEGREWDTDADVPSLFGKLGGLFGKKPKSGKQQVGSQK